MRNNRKTIAFITALAACTAAAAASPEIYHGGADTGVYAAESEVTEEGKLGGNISYTVYSDGKMTVSGYGVMSETIESVKNSDIVTALVVTPDKGKKLSLCEYAFAGMNGLVSLELSEGIDKIGVSAFEECSGLTEVTVPDSVESIGERAFCGCRSLKSAVLGKGINKIVSGIFGGCLKLEELTIGEIETERPEGDEWLAEDLQTVRMLFAKYEDDKYPECKVRKLNIAEGTKQISFFEFYDMEYLEEVSIPESVETISQGAFFSCKRLDKVQLPENLSTVSDFAFYGCEGLTGIEFPDKLKSIGVSAFEECSGLTEVTVPDSVESIGERAFCGCRSLKSAVLGKGINKIVSGIFGGCLKLEELTIGEIETERPEGDEWLVEDIHSMVKGKPAGDKWFAEDLQTLRTLFVEYEDDKNPNCKVRKLNIAEGTKQISFFEFYDMEYLEEVSIPESVETISQGAFFFCRRLEKVQLPEKLSAIGDYAFYLCEGLTGIEFPDKLKSIGEGAFEECCHFEEAFIPDSVTELGERAFSGCLNMKKASIGSGIKKVVPQLFCGCRLAEFTMPNLEVDIPEGDDWTEDELVTPRDMFCTEMITKAENGYAVTLNGSTSESSWIAPGGAEKINVLPGTDTISPYEFFGMEYLKDVVIPDGVVTISEGAFMNCEKLVSVVIPAGVKSVGKNAFRQNFVSKMNEVFIPDTVESIGVDAFARGQIEHIWYSGDEKSWEAIEIGDQCGDGFGHGSNEDEEEHFFSGLSGVEIHYNSSAEDFRGTGDVNGDGKT
ncbi:MAG: leucine-rich repeat domain-containing protein, partial [Oscillospiraceae bacterium]|nr:leucine-rich repeat domain-containing protein [Oscillospiraceae bacterium]